MFLALGAGLIYTSMNTSSFAFGKRKREICARYAARDKGFIDANKVARKLGIKLRKGSVGQIESFCAYYK